MKRVVMAAVAALGLWAAPAAAQTFFNVDGRITSYVIQPTTYQTSSPFNLVVAFDPSKQNPGGFPGTISASFRYTTPVIASGITQSYVGYGNVTAVSPTEYRIFAAAFNNNDTALTADLFLASPLTPDSGPMAVLPTSYVNLYQRVTNAYGYATSVTTAVPEATAWAMMVVGLGVVGGSLRRRRPTSARLILASM